jgi:hypothetical protein
MPPHYVTKSANTLLQNHKQKHFSEPASKIHIEVPTYSFSFLAFKVLQHFPHCIMEIKLFPDYTICIHYMAVAAHQLGHSAQSPT